MIQVPFISIVSDLQVNYIMKNPNDPSYILGTFTDFSSSTTFFQMVFNTIYAVIYIILVEVGVPPLREIAHKKFFRGEQYPLFVFFSSVGDPWLKLFLCQKKIGCYN